MHEEKQLLKNSEHFFDVDGAGLQPTIIPGRLLALYHVDMLRENLFVQL